MTGRQLLKTVIAATELPESALEKELSRLLEGLGVDQEQVTLDHLRDALASYLQDVLVEAKENLEQPNVSARTN